MTHQLFLRFLIIIGIVGFQTNPTNAQDLLRWLLGLGDASVRLSRILTRDEGWLPVQVPVQRRPPSQFLQPRPQQQPQRQQFRAQSFESIKPIPQQTPPVFREDQQKLPNQQLFPDIKGPEDVETFQKFVAAPLTTVRTTTTFPTSTITVTSDSINTSSVSPLESQTNASSQSSPLTVSQKPLSSLTFSGRSAFQLLSNSILGDMKMSAFITSTPDELKDIKVFNTVKPEILENTIFRYDKPKSV